MIHKSCKNLFITQSERMVRFSNERRQKNIIPVFLISFTLYMFFVTWRADLSHTRGISSDISTVATNQKSATRHVFYNGANYNSLYYINLWNINYVHIIFVSWNAFFTEDTWYYCLSDDDQIKIYLRVMHFNLKILILCINVRFNFL